MMLKQQYVTNYRNTLHDVQQHMMAKHILNMIFEPIGATNYSNTSHDVKKHHAQTSWRDKLLKHMSQCPNKQSNVTEYNLLRYFV